jgi:mono/diheme cytochrome c family protein
MTNRTVRRARRAAAAIAVGGGLLIAAGCGGHDPLAGDPEAGKTQFATLCASCHTLEDSGRPPSTVGPNLDDSFRAARQVGIADEQFAGVVLRWIREAQAPMPRDLVEGQDALDVAAYVASVAGTGDSSTVWKSPEWAPQVPDPPRQELAPPG